MLLKTATSLAFATACLTAVATLPAHAQMADPAPATEVITNGPQGSPPANWSSRQNVIESHQYDRLLETNRGFREARMRKECGPITDPELHQQCLASFHQYSSVKASAAHPRKAASSG